MESNNIGTIQNLSVNAHVETGGEDITMLYEVGKGSCERSFGIEVAKGNFREVYIKLTQTNRPRRLSKQVAKFPAKIIDDALQISADLELRSKKKA